MPEEIYSISNSFLTSLSVRYEMGWTIQKGDTGKFVLQTHIRGIEEWQKDLLVDFVNNERMGLGWYKLSLKVSDYSVLHILSDFNWEKEVKEAADKLGTTEKLDTEVKRIIKEKTLEDLSKKELEVLTKVSGYSIHTDLRLLPKGENKYQGGEFFSPGNQFHENKIFSLFNKEKVYLQFEPKRYKNLDEEGTKIWMDKGKYGAELLEPGTPGTYKNTWGIIYRQDIGTWEAGRQESANGKHFKELFFKSFYLNGRYIFSYVPIEDDKRIWIFSKPEK